MANIYLGNNLLGGGSNSTVPYNEVIYYNNEILDSYPVGSLIKAASNVPFGAFYDKYVTGTHKYHYLDHSQKVLDISSLKNIPNTAY